MAQFSGIRRGRVSQASLGGFLLLTVVLAAWLGYKALGAANSHRRPAEAVLHDYGSIAVSAGFVCAGSSAASESRSTTSQPRSAVGPPTRIDVVMADVFISHRSTSIGNEVASGLYTRLVDRGIDSFLDADKISPGDNFTSEILRGIHDARVVVVLFEGEPSSWVHFEAACAFFDHKLIPVSLDGTPVPAPYDQIQHQSLDTFESRDVTLDHVANQVEEHLRAATSGSRTKTAQDSFNSSFVWGWWALLALPGTVLLDLGLSPLDWLSHVHVVLGALYLGGLFFLSLAFAQALGAPGFQARESGFQVVDRVFRGWAVMAIAQPTLGIALWLMGGDTSSVPTWLFLAICCYATSLAFALAAYLLLRGTRPDEFDRRKRSDVIGRVFLSYVLFACAFVEGVWVVSLMVCKCAPRWLPGL